MSSLSSCSDPAKFSPSCVTRWAGSCRRRQIPAVGGGDASRPQPPPACRMPWGPAGRSLCGGLGPGACRRGGLARTLTTGEHGYVAASSDMGGGSSCHIDEAHGGVASTVETALKFNESSSNGGQTPSLSP